MDCWHTLCRIQPVLFIHVSLSALMVLFVGCLPPSLLEQSIIFDASVHFFKAATAFVIQDHNARTLQRGCGLEQPCMHDLVAFIIYLEGDWTVVINFMALKSLHASACNCIFLQGLGSRC